jgi:hypothetical protein
MNWNMLEWKEGRDCKSTKGSGNPVWGVGYKMARKGANLKIASAKIQILICNEKHTIWKNYFTRYN